MLGAVGKKLGMTRIFDAVGGVLPVTVIELQVGVVVQKKDLEKEEYKALQLGFGDIKKKHIKSPQKGHYAKSNLQAKGKLKEFRVDDLEAFEIGQELPTTELFVMGSYVDVRGVSKGKGFAGVIKRHGFSRGPETHGSRHHREPGSIGATGPSCVFKGTKLPGRKGNKFLTVQNLKVVRIDTKGRLLFVLGAVPGHRFAELVIKPAVKKLGSRN